ncbi:hypothetical protein [Paraburkholderia terrae]|uniref:hypothetical protein n=1 Tax=Paraburkholderia terrae TaxID=311230 RepID=UPI0033659375
MIEYSAPLLDVGIGYVDKRGATTVASDAAMVGIEEVKELLALHNIRGTSRAIDACGESVATVLCNFQFIAGRLHNDCQASTAAETESLVLDKCHYWSRAGAYSGAQQCGEGVNLRRTHPTSNQSI